MTTFYTSDTHFFHSGVLNKEFCARPFRNVFDMNVALVNRWNAVVRPGDIVHHLGDFAFEHAMPTEVYNLFNSLNGRKHLKVGNHDTDSVIRLPWVTVSGSGEVATTRGHMLRLSHYPPGNPKEGELHLHGHLHKRSPQRMPIFDVGVDANDFRPVAEHELDRAVENYRKGLETFRSLVAGRAI